MASEKPGGVPSGLGEITREYFGVSLRPTLDRAEVIRQARALLGERGIVAPYLGVSDEPLRRGMLIDLAGSRIGFPAGRAYDRCFVAFADPQPLAGWAHDAFWIFVPADGEAQAAIVAASFPAHGDTPAPIVAVEGGA